MRIDFLLEPSVCSRGNLDLCSETLSHCGRPPIDRNLPEADPFFEPVDKFGLGLGPYAQQELANRAARLICHGARAIDHLRWPRKEKTNQHAVFSLLCR